MAAENVSPDDALETTAQPAKSGPMMVSVRWLIGVVLSLFAVNAAATGMVWMSLSGDESKLLREVELGGFTYVGDPTETAYERIEFQLAVSLLPEVQEPAKALLKLHCRKVEQAVEELLRKSRDADFEDPELTDLKRRIQETVNHAINRRVIDEVLITDLQTPPR